MLCVLSMTGVSCAVHAVHSIVCEKTEHMTQVGAFLSFCALERVLFVMLCIGNGAFCYAVPGGGQRQ